MRREGEEGAGQRASERERVGWRRPDGKTGRPALRDYEFYKGLIRGWERRPISFIRKHGIEPTET